MNKGQNADDGPEAKSGSVRFLLYRLADTILENSAPPPSQPLRSVMGGVIVPMIFVTIGIRALVTQEASWGRRWSTITVHGSTACAVGLLLLSIGLGFHLWCFWYHRNPRLAALGGAASIVGAICSVFAATVCLILKGN